MENYEPGNYVQESYGYEPQGNMVAGIVGAFLFSFAGVILWFIIYQLGFIASIAGIVMMISTVKGYEIFGKRLTKSGLIICILITFIMVFASVLICLGYEIYQIYSSEYGITIFDALRAIPDFLKDPEVMGSVRSDLIMGYILTIVGLWGYIKKFFAKAQAEI